MRPSVLTAYCDPVAPYRADPALAPQATGAALAPELLARFPHRSLLVANAAGLLPHLQELLRLEAQARQQPGLAAEVAVLRQRQRVQTRLLLLRTTISSVAAELDCQGEAASQVANYLAQQDSRRTQRLTVWSLGMGAASGIGTTVLTNQPLQYTAGIGGGLVVVALGIQTLHVGSTIEFPHARNLLADVWAEKPVSTVFPPSVWYLLTDSTFSYNGHTSIVHNTRLRWQRYGQLAQPDSKQGQQLAALLFGPGGTYSASQLMVRADMLNELQAAVHLLDQQLLELLQQLVE
ncbi:hypothetical protein [Hymenobacter terricola]|uniref:hypothetical protein n=1 Tax=Hymenobacter terricola TaxID=2819236 RepID=UPI001CF22FE5|nr:hypothetical protein [Hymenobacter terricola]